MTDVAQLQALQKQLNADITDGDWVNKPAVPASTVTQANTSGHKAWVVITGGTVTAIKVDGVTVGALTSGPILVRPDSTIAITYSAAPTWQWFLFD